MKASKDATDVVSPTDKVTQIYYSKLEIIEKPTGKFRRIWVTIDL